MAHTIRELLERTRAFFTERGIDSPRLDAELLLAHALHEDRLKLYLDLDRPLAGPEVDAYRDLVRRRGRREPVAYITGQREFYGLPLAVSPAVLIPRPDTETLVDRVLERLAEDADGVVVDVGTGSGCIALALAHERKRLRAIGTDVSREALEVARSNAASLSLEDRVCFLEGDLLAPVTGGPGSAEVPSGWPLRPLLAVVGNPPYIKGADEPSLMPEVREHEPRGALFGEGPSGLGHHERILAAAGPLLGPGGFVALEIGFDQSGPARALPAPGFGAPEVHKDLSGNDRVLLWPRA